MEKIIVTSALPYVNGIAHLGNFVGSILPADIYYKYLLMKGSDAIFVCGSDQHGTPTELSAIKKGVPVEEFVEEMHERTKKSLDQFGCTFTFYGKTHTDQNKKTVYEIFSALRKNGYILEVEDMQAYCESDKRFIPDRFVEGTCPYCGGSHARGDQCDDCGRLLDPQRIIDPYCRICGKHEIGFRKTKNLAIDLTSLSDRILEFVKGLGSNISKNALNKTLTYIEGGLKPRDITRDIKWGFKVPVEGYEDKVFYVWFDDLIGYIGITKEWSEDKADSYWKDSNTKLVQFMGKDNIEFHTMMWPAYLIGSDLGYILPTRIMAYEYLNSGSIKFSKSRGVGINIENALEVMDADYWRFTLSYLLPETSDTEFTEELVFEVVNKIMNDKIGNFTHRVITISKRNPELISGVRVEDRYSENVDSAIHKYTTNFDSLKMREALRNIVELAEIGNEIMSNRKPWELAKTDGKEFAEVMGSALWICRTIGILMWPFCPSASKKILEHFGIRERPVIDMLGTEAHFDHEIGEVQIFSKLGDAESEKLSKFKS